MSETLLVTKLHIPPSVPNHVPRLRLFQLLDEGLFVRRRLALVSAPAGYGKTSLIAAWIHLRGLTAAWLSLDEGDNDPARFLAYLLAAIRAARPELGDLAGVQISPGGAIEPALVVLVNGLADLSGQFLIVLDDYHLISSQSIHDALGFLIDNLPAQVQVYIATRSDPPLPVPRWRARGQLVELRMSDLRFTEQEASILLSQLLGTALPAEDITCLASRTEGWAAGLQMAALALHARIGMQGSQNISAAIQDFTGTNRFILDYLLDEVIARQPGSLIAFLEQTSILELLCGALCDAVVDPFFSEAQDSTEIFPGLLSGGKILAYLERSNLFIVPLDDRRVWYRYHRLFADLNYQRLLQSQPELVPLLHQRASNWYAQNNLFTEAIHHALAAGDEMCAAELIEGEADSTLSRGEMATFISWIEALSDQVVSAHPNLVAYHALTLLWSSAPLEQIEARMALVERLVHERHLHVPHMQVLGDNLYRLDEPLRAFIALNRGQVAVAREYCRRAFESIPPGNRLMLGMAELMQAICMVLEGDVENGMQALEDSAARNRITGNLVVAILMLYQLAEYRQREGRLHQAEALYQQALELASDPQGNYLPIAGRALAGLGELAWIRNDLEKAEQYVLEGNELSQAWGAVSAFDGYLALVAIRQSSGNFSGAIEALQTLRKLARQYDLTDIDDRAVDLVKARLRLAQGDLAAVHCWDARSGITSAALVEPGKPGQDIISQRLYKYEIMVVAWVWLAEGRFADLLGLLDEQLARLRDITRPALVIETELLRALAFQDIREYSQSIQALEHALAVAEPEGYLCIFLDGGDKVRSLLANARPLIKDRTLSGFLDRLLNAFPSTAPRKGTTRPPRAPQIVEPLMYEPLMYEPLSERELEVLRLLTSSLSSQEMADELFVSIHTLRSHLKNIYEKLDAHSRYEAVNRARELKLL